MTEHELEKIAKKHFTETQLKAHSITRWKDGIDIDEYPQLQAYTNEVIEMCAFELEQHLDGSDIGDDSVNSHICSSAKIIRNIKVKEQP
jgi:hypothetical protein